MKEQAINWAGETTLKELAALAHHADMFISTDTGPMHLAAAAGAQCAGTIWPHGSLENRPLRFQDISSCAPRLSARLVLNHTCKNVSMHGFHNCRYGDQCDSAIERLLRLNAGVDALPASLLFGLAKTRRCRLQHRYGLWHIGKSYACHVVKEKNW